MAHRDQIDNLEFSNPDEGYFYYLKKSHDILAYTIFQYALVILAVLSWILGAFSIYIKLAHLILFAFLGLVISQFFYKNHLKKNIARNREAAKDLVNNYHQHPQLLNKFMKEDQNSFTKLPIAQIFYNQSNFDQNFINWCFGESPEDDSSGTEEFFQFACRFLDEKKAIDGLNEEEADDALAGTEEFLKFACDGLSEEEAIDGLTETDEFLKFAFRYPQTTTLSLEESARLSAKLRTAYSELSRYIKLIFREFISKCFYTGNVLENALEFRKALECYQALKDFLESFNETVAEPVVQELLKKNLGSITNEINFDSNPFTISYKSDDCDNTSFDIGVPIIDEALIEIDLRYSRILRRLRLPLTAISCNSRGIKKCEEYIAKFRPNFNDRILACYWGEINHVQLSLLLLKWYEIQDISTYSHPNKALLRPLLIDLIDFCKKTLSNYEPLSCGSDTLSDCSWYNIMRQNQEIENYYLGQALLILNGLDHKPISGLLNQVLDFLPKLAASLVNYFFKGHIARSMKKDLIGDDWKLELQKV
jgi:hypothetical protein